MHKNLVVCPVCTSGRLLPVASNSSELRCKNCGAGATRDDVTELEFQQRRDWIPPDEREKLEYEIARMFRV